METSYGELDMLEICTKYVIKLIFLEDRMTTTYNSYINHVSCVRPQTRSIVPDPFNNFI